MNQLPFAATRAATESLQAQTLAELYEKRIRPLWVTLGHATATLREYNTAVRLWSDYWASGAHSVMHTECALADSAPNPSLQPAAKSIDDGHLLQFRSWLAAGDRSPRTSNKHVASLIAILNAASISIPRIKRLACRAAAIKHYLTDQEVSQLYQSAGEATWPQRDSVGRGIVPADQWQAAIVMFFNFGFRTQELLSYSTNHHALTWSNVWTSATSPAEGSRAINEHGWLWYVPQKQKRSKPDPLVLPLPKVVREHLESIRPSHWAPEMPVFNWVKNPRLFRRQWAAIAAGSGVVLKPSLKQPDPKLQLGHMRKTCSTLHDFCTPGISAYILGHAKRNSESVITDRHYNNPELALLAHYAKVDQPCAFAAIMSRRDRQMRLFA